jgi:DNA repair exonuclease SbcCD ATPase subunit
MTDISKLTELKEEIEESKTKLAKLEGKLENFQAQLSEEFGCNSLDDAQIMLDKLEHDIKEMEKDLEGGYDKMEQTYNEYIGAE